MEKLKKQGWMYRMRKKEVGQRGIKTQLVTFVSVTLLLLITVLSVSSVYFTSKSTEVSLQKTMRETSELIANKITEQLDQYVIVSEAAILYKENSSALNLSSYLQTISSKYNLQDMDITDSSGISYNGKNNYAQDAVFQKAIGGQSFLSDAIVEGEEVYFEFGHSYKNSVVMLKIPYSVFEEIIAGVQIGETGSTYILNNQGVKMAHKDFSLVQKKQNNLDEVKKDPKLYKEVAALETEMTQGKSGFGFYVWKGDKKFGSYTPIDGTNGWSVNVTALESEFMSGVKTSAICTVGLGIFALLISILATIRIASRITKPIQEVVTAIEKMSEGDLNIDLSVHRQDEMGLIAMKINEMVRAFRDIISDISHFLKEIEDGRLTAQAQSQYPGEFSAIKQSMENIVGSLNRTMMLIHETADQVNIGAEQVSAGAQALSSGTTEQAATVEQLSASVTSVAHQAERNAVSVQKATEYVEQSVRGLSDSNEYMQRLSSAMMEIGDSSQEISKITKLVEDIAFQTNILALNAAVEAARAGNAGKGFAVVADEVRNLAAKSAEAAKQTAQLIEKSTAKVSEGEKLADETLKCLVEVSDQSAMVASSIQEIETASAEQATAIAQINQGLTQVSAVVQTNAATAEESSASSEELAAQAQTLQSEVGKFKLADAQSSWQYSHGNMEGMAMEFDEDSGSGYQSGFEKY
ncbi:methyl-accepting chemotaxis protein [Anaerotignum propionicum]|uniref:methyl-accepting chemotaxis protein n=1 Tax=Anaerotignum propionicum TaxID=28446 RepID=UPI00289CDF9F|nr:methyl-accepting chemotaxis protein [Anaerotignum propionicum]